MSADCVFCKIVTGEIPSKVVYETETVIAFEDLNPVAPTHVLVIPKKHVASLAVLTDADRDIMGDVILAVQAVAQVKGVEDAFRLVVNSGAKAGQVVFHTHFHVIAGRPFGWPPG